MRLKTAYILLVFILLAASSPAQTAKTGLGDKPNFSGIWKLNTALSTKQKDLKDLTDAKLEISATDAKLKVVRTLQFQNHTETSKLVYYTDKRGEKNPKFRGFGRWKTKTRWSNLLILPVFPIYQLVSEYTVTKHAATTYSFNNDDIPYNKYTQKVTDTWNLSADGKTLTITTSVSDATIELERTEVEIGRRPEGEIYKKVFDKVD